jgi:hypothetical protein
VWLQADSIMHLLNSDKTWNVTHKLKQNAYSFQNNNFNSKFAQQPLENGHPMGTAEEVMQILHMTDREPRLEFSEKLHIYGKPRRLIR